jgi:ABC-type sugar transport system substrate-binding protein
MRKFKSLVVVALIAAMIISLAACGTSAPASSESAAASGAAPSESASAAASESTDANADAADTGDLTGLKVGYAQRNATGAWLIAQTKSIQDEAAKRGVDLQVTIADDQQAQQLTDVENIVASGVDYLVYAPIEAESGAAALDTAKEAGVPVILLGNDCTKTEDQYAASLQFDFVQDAQIIAQWVADNIQGQINIFEITGIEGSDPAIKRHQGLQNVVDANSDRMKIVVSQSADFLLDKAQSVAENVLQSKKGEFNVIFAQTDEMALGALAAVKAAGLTPGKDVYIVGIDGQKAAVQAIIDGELAAVSTCDTQNGTILFDTIAQIKAGALAEKNITIPSFIIDSSNANEKLATAF